MRTVKLLGAFAASVCIICPAASAREYPTNPNSYRVSGPLWTVCEFSFYAPQASGDPHAGETALQLWTSPFKPSGDMQFEIYRYSPGFSMMTGELADEYLRFLSQHLGRTEEHFERSECHFYSSEGEAQADIPNMMRRSVRNNSVVPPPTKAMLARAIKKAVEASTETKTKDSSRPWWEQIDTKPKQDKVAKPAQQEVTPTGPTPAEIAAEKHRAVEERNRLAQEKYKAELAEQQRKVEEFERAKEEVARKQAEQKAAAQAALAQHVAEVAAAAEAQRKHEAELAAYKAEVETAAGKVRSDFDKRHNLGQASTDSDANQCVTTPETQLNASFQGNTAASVVNGCGKPVDVRICLMTEKGWNCAVTYGLASQQRWSHSSFNATGQVFSDARSSGSSRSLASPN